MTGDINIYERKRRKDIARHLLDTGASKVKGMIYLTHNWFKQRIVYSSFAVNKRQLGAYVV